MRAQTLLTLKLEALVGYLTRFLLCIHDMESVASLGCAVQSQYNRGMSRTDIVGALTALVCQVLNTAKACSGNDIIADAQCTIADDDRCHITTSFIQG